MARRRKRRSGSGVSPLDGTSVALCKYDYLNDEDQFVVAPGFSPAYAALKGGATVNVFSERNTSVVRHTWLYVSHALLECGSLLSLSRPGARSREWGGNRALGRYHWTKRRLAAALQSLRHK